MNSLDPDLVRLAEAHGVMTSYTGWRGDHVKVPSSTLLAVLGALGVDAADLSAALDAARLAPWRRLLPPYVVGRAGQPVVITVHAPDGAAPQAQLALEGGTRVELGPARVDGPTMVVDGELVRAFDFAVPASTPLGWHVVHAEVDDTRASAPLAVTPDRLPLPARREWGLMPQLYSVRSRGSWGLGDLHDLADLARWSAAELGAGFILTNPLHAASPVAPMEPSPYFPSSRRFRNPVYLRVEDVPEVAALPADEVHEVAEPLRARSTGDDLLDRDAVWSGKRAVLLRAFDAGLSPDRERAFADWRTDQGQGLDDFATWCVLVEEHGVRWRSWPAGLRAAHSADVAAFRRAHRQRVGFYAWLQWLVDGQLEAVQRVAQDAGMALGVVGDLAVGVDPDGADAWLLGDVLADGVGVGAPPDAFNQQGQNWGQPPWHPVRLAEAGLAPYRDMVRSAFRHSGGLRLDHVLGLFRQWWVPGGASAAAGTYVRFDHEALVGVVALEAHRAGALAIGEDIGTVEPWVHDYLGERGILGTSILWFERDARGRPLPPERWRGTVLASVTTHDLPPTAGYLAGDHVTLRDSLGLLTRPVDVEATLDGRDRQAWLDLLVGRGLLAPGETNVDAQVVALHGLLWASPALLLGVVLPDVTGERRPQNQPGTLEEYPNWRLPLGDAHGRSVLLEDVMALPQARLLARAVLGQQASVTVALSEVITVDPREP